MNFTLRFLLGFALVLLCSPNGFATLRPTRNTQFVLSNPSRSRREDYKQNLEPLFNIRNKARRRTKDELVLDEAKFESEPKTETTNSDKYIKTSRIRIPNNVNKPTAFPSGADNVETSTKLRKSVPYRYTEDVYKGTSRSYQKETDSYPRNRYATYPRAENRQSVAVDATKFYSEDVQNKNKVYTLPVTSNAQKYLNGEDIFKQNTHSDFILELTTPKEARFDNKYDDVVRGVHRKLEDFDFYFGKSNNDFTNTKGNTDDITLDDLMEQTKNNDTDTNLEYMRYKKLEANDSKKKNKIHKDYVSEQATNLSFRSSYNETHVINEDIKDEQNNIPASDKETIIAPDNRDEIFEQNLTKHKNERTTEYSFHNEGVDEDNIANPLGDEEIVDEYTPRSNQVTTRKNYALTKTPTIIKNGSRNSLLSNKIETEIIKPIEIMRSTKPISFSSTPAIEDLKGETENKRNNNNNLATRYVPIMISKRGSIKFLDTTTQISTKLISEKRKLDGSTKFNKTGEQAVQENQIVPVQILAPEDNTKEPDSSEKHAVKIEENIELITTAPPSTTPIEENMTTTSRSVSDELSSFSTTDGSSSEESTENYTITSTTLQTTTSEVVPKTHTDMVMTETISTFENFSFDRDETTESFTTDVPSSEESISMQNTDTTSSSGATTESTMTSLYLERNRSETSTLTSLTDLFMFTDSFERENTNAYSDEDPTSTVEISDSTEHTWAPKTTNKTKHFEENGTTNNRMNTQRELDFTTFTLPETTTKPHQFVTESDENSSEYSQTSTGNERVTSYPKENISNLFTTMGEFETTTMSVITDFEMSTEEQPITLNTLPPKLFSPKTEPSITIVQPTKPKMTPTPVVPALTEYSTEEETTDTTSTENLEGGDPKDEMNTGTIAAIAISCIGAVCLMLLTGLLIIMRKRQKHFNYGQRCTPVSLDDYSMDHVAAYSSVRRKGAARSSKRSYGNPAFDDPTSVTHVLNFPALAKFALNEDDIKEEFEEIPQVTAQTTELPEGCETRNRYANVIPLPETRVFLSPIDGYPNSDYINANYVTGPKSIRGYYIATQAPMQSTIDDFWRMIWEQQSKVILMLTHLFENGVEKCIDYLPPSEVLDCHRLFGDFQVTLKKREVKDKYIISSLQLKNMVSNSWREVTHLWYLGWPDKGVPPEENSIIAFLIEARSYVKIPTDKGKEINCSSNGNSISEVNPVVVHCSPGTGRTGTLIACDIAIREFELTRQVDIPRIVYRIRRDRASSVQTKEQYSFIYKVISLYATKLTGGALDSF